MSIDLTNLLPEARSALLRRVYFLRLGTLGLLLAVLLVASAAALLLPTNAFIGSEVHTKTAQLATINSGLTSADEVALSSRLASLSQDATILSSLASAPSATAIIRQALAVPGPGITLSSFSYTPGDGKNPGTLELGGTALTRDALRSYQLALQSAAFASKADLPVSAYAKDTDIDFTITVTLSP